MPQKLVTRVNDQFDFEFDQTEVDHLDASKTKHNSYHIIHKADAINAEIIAADFLNKNYQVKINANIYEVKINDDLDLLIKELGLSLGSSQLQDTVKAPMPGLILDIKVKEGDEVKEGDYVMVLEAMKMENTLVAPRDGVVKSIQAKEGDGVSKNQLLIEFD
jgi:biotin carboxyl carrier protein